MNRRKLHEQARRAIERLIADRGIKAGSRIPSESKLAGELYVSRTTIRRALKDLHLVSCQRWLPALSLFTRIKQNLPGTGPHPWYKRYPNRSKRHFRARRVRPR
jgi:DNA-binding transcriptional MocR family regulator